MVIFGQARGNFDRLITLPVATVLLLCWVPAPHEFHCRDGSPKTKSEREFRPVYGLFSIKISLSVSPVQEPLPDSGCIIELTKIGLNANGSDWLTVGFEAFGRSGRVIAMLDAAIDHFFKAHGSAPVLLDGCDSISYPTWLTFAQ